MRGDRARKMTTDFALAFTTEAVTLLRADGDGWLPVGSATVGASDFAARVAALRAKATDATATPPRVALVLPVEHVLSGHLPTDCGDEAEPALRQALAARGAPDPAQLLWAITPLGEEGPRRYCAALRETVEEAARYARSWGFEPTGACAPDGDGGAARPPIPTPAIPSPVVTSPMIPPQPEQAAAPSTNAPPTVDQPPLEGVASPAQRAPAAPSAATVQARRRVEPRPPTTGRRNRGALAIWVALGATAIALAALALLVAPEPPKPSADRRDAPPATAIAPTIDADGAQASRVETAVSPAPPPATDDGAAAGTAAPPDPATLADSGPAASPGLPPRPEPPVVGPAPEAQTTGDVGAAHMADVPTAQVEAASGEIAEPRDAVPAARAAVEIADPPSAIVAALTPSLDPPPDAAPARQAAPPEPLSPAGAEAPRPVTAPDAPPPTGSAAPAAPPTPAARPGEGDEPAPAEPVAAAETPEPDLAAPAENAPPAPATILPPVRPQSFAIEAVTRQAAAVDAGPRPAPRPRGLAAAAAAPTPSSEPARAAPSNAPRSIRAAATINDGLPEGLALLGVFGSSDGRRALVRGEDGAVLRVRRGDRIDGWSVASIEADAIRLTAGGRSQTLRVPGR